jgi:hypothetical protein
MTPLPAAWRHALSAWVAAKLVALVLAFGLWRSGWLAIAAANQPDVPEAYTGPVSSWTLGVWQRLDTLRYLDIAAQGYRADNGNSVFPPLYPLLIRAFTPLALGHALVAALLVSNLAFVVALGLLYRLVEPRLGADTARRSVWLLTFFPSAYYLQAGYTEPVYLALALGAFLALDAGGWWRAGLLALAATLTRVQGVALSVPLAFEYWRRQHWSWRGLFAPQALAAALAPAGLLAFWLWQRAQGLPLFTEVAERDWGAPASWPWATVASAVALAAGGSAPPARWIALAAFSLFCALALAAAWPYLRRSAAPPWPASWAVYMVALLVLLITRNDPFRPLLSMSRHVLMLFPGFVLLAYAGRRPWAWRAIFYPCLLLYVLFLTIFFLWGYVE